MLFPHRKVLNVTMLQCNNVANQHSRTFFSRLQILTRHSLSHLAVSQKCCIFAPENEDPPICLTR